MQHTHFAIAAGVADIRRDPDAHSELVTQALLNMPAHVLDTYDEWTRIALVDYEGWIRSNELDELPVRGFCKVGEQCATPLALSAVILQPSTPLYQDAEGTAVVEDNKLARAYLSSTLPLVDTTQARRVQVALPGERTAWLERSAIAIRQGDAPYPQEVVTHATQVARLLLDVPYLWGGTSVEGIDCSGLVQLSYRMCGYMLPRDANQQDDALAQAVTIEEMQEGDLIFFGSASITHVALAVSNHEYIHAEGNRYQRVLINSFDPNATNYDQRLRELVWGLKRVTPDMLNANPYTL